MPAPLPSTTKLSPAPCDHDPALNCGCWVNDEGVTERHSFRFLEGDKVALVGFPGVRGTVARGGRHLFIEWDAPWKGLALAFPAIFEVRHAPTADSGRAL